MEPEDISRLHEIDHVCDDFERLLRSGESPTSCDFLDGWHGEDRDELFRNLLAIESNYLGIGQRTERAEAYRHAFPNCLNEIEQYCTAAVETARLTSQETAERKTSEDFWPLPFQFGRYRLESKLGQGAMGTVYQAEDTVLRRKIALKIPKGLTSSEHLHRFYREARAAASLQHRNVCPVYDIGEHDGTHFLAMALINGATLERYITRATVPWKSAAKLTRKMANGLQAAHEKGIVHRDIKPANIMIDEEKEPVVMDFGLARAESHDDAALATQSGCILGTPAFMSPEQARGANDQILPASDVYGLGCVLYQMLTGKVVFEGSITDVLVKIVTETPPAPHELDPAIPADVSQLCMRMLEKDPADRFASMTNVSEAISVLLRNVSSEAAASNKTKSSDTLIPDTATAEVLKSDVVTIDPQVTPMISKRRNLDWKWAFVPMLAFALLVGLVYLVTRLQTGETQTDNKPLGSAVAGRFPAGFATQTRIKVDNARFAKLSANGSLFINCQEGSLDLYDATNARVMSTLQLDLDSPVLGSVFGKDGLFIGAQNSILRIDSVNQRISQRASVVGLQQLVRLPNETLLTVEDEGWIIRDPQTLLSIKSVGRSRGSGKIEVSPTGDRVLSSVGNRVSWTNIQTGEVTPLRSFSSNDLVDSLVLSKSGDVAFVVYRSDNGASGHVIMWKRGAAEGKELDWTHDCVCLSGDIVGDALIVGDSTGGLWTYDAVSGQRLSHFPSVVEGESIDHIEADDAGKTLLLVSGGYTQIVLLRVKLE